MTPEIEAAALDSAATLGNGHRHPARSGLPCLNCGEIVEQRYCTACGQLATDFHRPWWDLVATSLGDTFLVDGRLARTIPLLLFKPGRLTRNYLDGQRARYVPPFRMLLLSSVIFFLAIFTLSDRLGWFDSWKLNFSPTGDFYFGPESSQDWMEKNIERSEAAVTASQAALDSATRSGAADPGDLADLKADLEEAKADLIEAKSVQTGATTSAAELQNWIKPDGTIDRVAMRKSIQESADMGKSPESVEEAFKIADRAAYVYEHQDLFAARIREWAPRVSLFLFPILTLLLAIAYAWRRRFFVFDHLVTALHFQTFMYVLATLNLALAAISPMLLAWSVLASVLILFVYLYRQIRVTYASGHIQSLVRATFLSLAGLTTLTLLVVGLVVLSFMTV